MAALYDLQTALIDAVAQRPEFSSLLDGFKQNREIVRKEWERNLAFLQESQGYADDYLSLCQFALDEPASDCLAFARNILQVARKVTDQVLRAKSRHDNLYQKFQKQRYGLESILSSTGPSSIALTHGALRLDGRDALLQSYTALREIGTAFVDLVAFWKNHVGYMEAITSENAQPFLLTKEELRQSADTWRQYKPMLAQAVMSISLSCDAVAVDAKGTFRSLHSSKPMSALQSSDVQEEEVQNNDSECLPFTCSFSASEILLTSSSDYEKKCNGLPKFPNSRPDRCAKSVSLFQIILNGLISLDH
jgi:hypothetical protein